MGSKTRLVLENRKTGLGCARSQHVEKVGQEVDSDDARIEVLGENQCRRARAAADVGDLQPLPPRQARQFDGTSGFRGPARSLPISGDVKVDQKREVVHDIKMMPDASHRASSASPRRRGSSAHRIRRGTCGMTSVRSISPPGSERSAVNFGATSQR